MTQDNELCSAQHLTDGEGPKETVSHLVLRHREREQKFWEG
jgi:hypothetical protein